MIRLAALLVCSLLITTAQAAEDAPWERVFPSLDNVYAVLWYDLPTTWWVTSWSDEHGLALLRTNDDGASWETIASGLGHTRPANLARYWRYAVCRSDPSVIYRSESHIERTDDGGATWSPLWPVELRPRDFQDDEERDVVVSPTDSDRIAYVHHSDVRVGQSAIVTDLAGAPGAAGAADDIGAWAQGGAAMWAHPETGTVYWHASTLAGAVDFANVQFAGAGAKHAVFGVYGGVGFASDDPAAPLWPKYDIFQRSPDVLVFDADGTEVFTLPAVTSLVASPESVAVHRPTHTVFLTGRTRVSGGPRRETVLASTDGGERWSQVGAFRGQMYFLSGREALYMQTANDLLMLPLLPPTTVSAAGRAATTWSAIKSAGSVPQ